MAAIEPTSAMRLAFAEAPGADKDCICAVCLNHRLAAVLALVEQDQANELADLRALFRIQWTRSREADARWRAEDPEARANVWPDLGVLLRWLMDEADRQGRAFQDAEYDLGKLRGALKLAGGSRNLWRQRAIEAGWTSTPPPPRCGHRRRGMECELADGHGGRHGRSSWEEWS